MTSPVQPRRRSVRLRGYDYGAPGGYFLTICAADRRAIFADARIRRIVDAAWLDLPNHHPRVEVDRFVVMPNHVHGILFLGERDADAARAQRAAPLQRRGPRVETGTLAAIVRSFKARVTREIRPLVGDEITVWQRNYHDHVIRNEAALERIRQYIIDNPARWSFDRENPSGRPDAAERDFESWMSRVGFLTPSRSETCR